MNESNLLFRNLKQIDNKKEIVDSLDTRNYILYHIQNFVAKNAEIEVEPNGKLKRIIKTPEINKFIEDAVEALFVAKSKSELQNEFKKLFDELENLTGMKNAPSGESISSDGGIFSDDESQPSNESISDSSDELENPENFKTISDDLIERRNAIEDALNDPNKEFEITKTRKFNEEKVSPDLQNKYDDHEIIKMKDLEGYAKLYEKPGGAAPGGIYSKLITQEDLNKPIKKDFLNSKYFKLWLVKNEGVKSFEPYLTSIASILYGSDYKVRDFDNHQKFDNEILIELVPNATIKSSNDSGISKKEVSEINKTSLIKTLIINAVLNNADEQLGNTILDSSNNLRPIDFGVSEKNNTTYETWKKTYKTSDDIDHRYDRLKMIFLFLEDKSKSGEAYTLLLKNLNKSINRLFFGGNSNTDYLSGVTSNELKEIIDVMFSEDNIRKINSVLKSTNNKSSDPDSRIVTSAVSENIKKVNDMQKK